MNRLLFFLVGIFLCLTLFSQESTFEKQQLAFEYFRNKEYEKAASLFAELYKEQSTSYYFTYYIFSLNQLNAFEEAEKAIKREIKRKPTDVTYKIMLGNEYKLMNRVDEMKKVYDEVLKSITNNQTQILEAANMFISYQEYSLAEAVYLKGQKLLKGSYHFRLELANLYQIQKLFDKMIDEYLLLLQENPAMIQTVQNLLQQVIYNNQEDRTLLRLLQEKIISHIQKDYDAIILNELLIWIYIQQNQFSSALFYATSLDKRLKEDGSRIYTIGQLAFANKDYNTALKAFRYVIDKGQQGSWFYEAKSDYLQTLYYQIIEDKTIDVKKVVELEQELEKYLNSDGLTKNTFSVAKILAQLRAFYLTKSDEAIALLKQIIQNNSFSSQQINEAKLLLGDIMLMKNEIWEATILYTQVEKNSVNEPITHEAKFKKAMLAYFTGDFLWAQAQTNVLKASTSKLIANDAFALSQFIDENLAIDSTQKILQTFSIADFYVFKRQDSLALLLLDSVLANVYAYELHDDALLKKADIYAQRKQYNVAIALYDTLLSKFSNSINAPIAAYKLSNIYQYTLNDKDKAMHYLQLLFTNYPGSFYSSEARKRFRKLRGDIAPEEDIEITHPMPSF